MVKETHSLVTVITYILADEENMSDRMLNEKAEHNLTRQCERIHNKSDFPRNRKDTHTEESCDGVRSDLPFISFY